MTDPGKNDKNQKKKKLEEKHINNLGDLKNEITHINGVAGSNPQKKNPNDEHDPIREFQENPHKFNDEDSV